MQSIQVFNNPAFGNIRVAGTEANPQFCLTDVCKALGLTAKFVNQRLAKEVVSNHPLETASTDDTVSCIRRMLSTQIYQSV